MREEERTKGTGVMLRCEDKLRYILIYDIKYLTEFMEGLLL